VLTGLICGSSGRALLVDCSSFATVVGELLVAAGQGQEALAQSAAVRGSRSLLTVLGSFVVVIATITAHALIPQQELYIIGRGGADWGIRPIRHLGLDAPFRRDGFI